MAQPVANQDTSELEQIDFGDMFQRNKKEASLLTYLAGEGFTVISGLVELVIKEKEEISRALLPFLLQKLNSVGVRHTFDVHEGRR